MVTMQRRMSAPGQEIQALTSRLLADKQGGDDIDVYDGRLGEKLGLKLFVVAQLAHWNVSCVGIRGWELCTAGQF